MLLEELRAPTHHCPHLGVTQQTFANVVWRRIETLVEPRVGCDRLDQRFGEQEIMDGISCRAGDRRGALHHVRVAYRPFVGLLRAHGAADNQFEALQAELVSNECVLCAHVIADAHMGKVPHPGRRRRVVR